MDTNAPNPGLTAQLYQLARQVKCALDMLRPLVDQPVSRFPYALPLATSAVLAAGANNVALLQQDFANSLEWPFEIHYIKFSQDPQHTFRDWRINIQDLTFSQQMMRAPTMIAKLVFDNTGAWEIRFPWIVRPKGGGLIVSADNLDAVNPITVDVCFVGCLLIPRA